MPMTDEQFEAVQKTVDYLDDLMQEAPNKQLAAVSNFLQNMLDHADD